jgi:acetyl esterase
MISLEYGSDERNKLDVYEPEAKPSDKMPVLIFVHGGAFRGGDKKNLANIGYYFARHGVLAIGMTYRLAPKAKWPAGAEDVGFAVAWARANVPAYGGDPDKIVLMGHSAGAAHVAAFALTEQVQSKSSPGVAGVVLVSGTYDVAFEYSAGDRLGLSRANTINADYYGTNTGAYPRQSIVRNLAARTPPVMIAYAELDPPWMQMEAGVFFKALCDRTNDCPGLVWLAGHDHISEMASINTQDDALTAPVLEFVKGR